ncbi:MAG: hypothetical protein CL926_12980 [Deltaproteobacteria bacterium]|nr:hypothetical protein [Deltaproteobacteria bacterium]
MRPIVFLTIPRSFDGEFYIRQMNCLNSIKTQHPASKIIFYSKDKGLCELSEGLGIDVPNTVITNNGVPLIYTAFLHAIEKHPTAVITFVNSDIILTHNIDGIAKSATQRFGENWLVSSERRNVDVPDMENFWDKSVYNRLLQKSENHRKSGMDIFMFTSQLKPTLEKLPRLQVGRPGWDSALIAKSRKQNLNVIDASQSLTILHQNHRSNYPTDFPSFLEVIRKTQTIRLGTLRDTNFIMKQCEVRRNFLGTLTGSQLGLIIIGTLRLIKKGLTHFLTK